MAKLKPNQFILSGHLITELPILYQTEMVRAILTDRKTQTRREFNQPSYLKSEKHRFKGMGYFNGNINQFAAAIGTDHVSTFFKSKHGRPGDLLWVRETWNYDRIDLVSESEFHIPTGIGCAFVYKAENPEGSHPEHGKMSWKPSIHMPKKASRLWLMVEDIRVERLQDISEADAIAEGIEPIDQHGVKVWKRYDGYYTVTSKPYVSFWSLWAAINGDESWNSNPWVWVIKFRVLSKTGRPSDAVILENYLEVTGKEVANG